MKVHEAIDTADALLRNGISEPLKVRWLAELDGRVWTYLYNTHKDADGITLSPASSGWTDYVGELLRPTGTVILPITTYDLFASFPHDDIYIPHLMTMLYLSIKEINRANTELAVFTEAYNRYSSYINREYMPVKATNITLG